MQHGEDHACPGDPEDGSVDPLDGRINVPLLQEDRSRFQQQNERIEGDAQADLFQEGMDIEQTGIQDVIELVPATDIQEEQGCHDSISDQTS